MAEWPYNTGRWQRLRLLKLSQDPLCEHCAMAGRVEPADQVDHIKAINSGGDAWELENFASLCQSCHSAKTRAEMQGKEHIVKGVDPLTGKPVDPAHPFNDEKSLRADDLKTAAEPFFRVS